MNKINLIKDTIDKSDIDYLIKWLKTYPMLTKGEQTIKLEKKYSESGGPLKLNKQMQSVSS